MSTRNREITFIVKMRNQARQAINGLSGDLRKSAREAARAAAAHKLNANAMDQVQVSANQAAAAVSKFNKNVGGAVDPLNRKTKATRGLWKEIKEAAKQMVLFAAVAAAITGPVLATGAILEASADYRALQSRIALVTDTQAESNQVMGEVFSIAQRTRSGLEGVGTLYYRTAAAVREFGFSQKDALAVTELTAQAIKVSGTSAAEAQGALIQFSQALASNRLGGEELRSVMEQAPRLARAIIDGINATSPELAEKYGQTILKTVGGATTKVRQLTMGSFKKMAEDGVLTATVVMDALLSQADKMAEEFGKYPLLARDAAVNVKNAFMKEAAQIDMMFGLNSGLAKSLIMLGTDVVPLLSDAMQPVADLLSIIANLVVAPFELAGKAMSALGVSAEGARGAMELIVRLMSSALITGGLLFGLLRGGPIVFGMLAKAATTAATAIKALTVAMVANPFLAIAVAVTALIALFLTFQDSMVKVGDKSYSVGSLIIETWNSVMNFLGNIWSRFIDFAQPAIDAVAKVWGMFCEWIVSETQKSIVFVGQVFSMMKDIYAKYVRPFFEALGKLPGWYAGIIRTVWNNLAGFLRSGMTMLGGFVSIFNAEWGAKIAEAGRNGASVLEGVGEAYASAVEGIPDMIVDGVQMAARAVQPVLGAIGESWRDAFSDQGARMEARDRRRGLQQEQIANADLSQGNGNQVQADPKKDKDAENAAKKAAAERLKRVKELASAIKSLTSAYVPWLESSLKDVEAQEQLAALDLARAQSLDEFKDALDRANMSLAQYEQLAYAVSNNLKADAVKNFFSAYVDGWEQIVDQQERLKTNEVVSALVAAQAASLEGGETSRLRYEAYLRGLGITADQAAAAIARFNNGLTTTEFDAATEGLKGFIEANAPYAAQLQAQRQAVSDLAGMEQLRTTNGEEFQRMLTRLGYTMETYNEALRNANLNIAAQSDGWAAAKAAAAGYIEDIKVNGLKMRDVFDNAFSNMTDALTDFISTGKLDFKGLVDSMIADLARLAAQKMVMQFASSVMGMPFPIGHSGGIVGAASDAARTVSPAVFSGAKRYHVGGIVGSGGGLRSKEVPVIARENEAIMPTARMSDGNLGVKAILPDGWEGRNGGGAGGSSTAKTVVLSPTIHLTVEGGSKDEAEKTGEVVSGAILAALKGMVKEVLVDESRPGGILNQD